MKNILVIFNYSLDGVVSYLLLKKILNNYNLSYIVTSPYHFEENIKKLLISDIKKYDSIFILDLDVSESYDSLINNNYIIFDHHDSHIDNKPKKVYKNIKSIVRESSSTVLMLYNFFKNKKNINLSKEEKKLIIYTDDYDSGINKYIESEELNTIFWESEFDSDNKINKFIFWFKDGYKLLDEHKTILQLQKNQNKIIPKNIEIYGNKLKLSGQYYNVYSVISEINVNSLMNYIFNRYNCDIVIIVNPSINRVFIKRNKNCKFNVHKLAKKLCKGYGFKYFAYGKITDEFIVLTKLLKKI